MANSGQPELILSTIAVVLGPYASPTPIGIGINVDIDVEGILRRPLNISQGPEGSVITSNRDQVEVRFLTNKLDVRESSGEVTQAKSKVPRIVHGFLDELAEIEIQSYGVNFILEIGEERPREWLGNHLLNPDLASQLGPSLSSNLVTLLFDQPPKTWTVRFQALPGNRLNVNFNASEVTSELPSQEKLGYEIEEQYEALKKFLFEIGL